MQAAAASSPEDVEGDESLRSFVDDLDDVLGVQWPSASPAARAEDWLPALTRAVSQNRAARTLEEEKEAVVIHREPPAVVAGTRQPLSYQGRLLPLPHSSSAAHPDASKPSPASLVEISSTEGATNVQQDLQAPMAVDRRKAPVLLNDEPYSRQNLALFEIFCERLCSPSPLIQLASPHSDCQCPARSRSRVTISSRLALSSVDPLFCGRTAATGNAASAYLVSASQPNLLESQPVGAEASLAIVSPASVTHELSSDSPLPGFRSPLVPPAVSAIHPDQLLDFVHTAPARSISESVDYAVTSTDEMFKARTMAPSCRLQQPPHRSGRPAQPPKRSRELAPARRDHHCPAASAPGAQFSMARQARRRNGSRLSRPPPLVR